VRTLPKVLKFLPSDKAQDARNFVQGLQYWLGGNSENLQVRSVWWLVTVGACATAALVSPLSAGAALQPTPCPVPPVPANPDTHTHTRYARAELPADAGAGVRALPQGRDV
jgi:hypothetical protein